MTEVSKSMEKRQKIGWVVLSLFVILALTNIFAMLFEKLRLLWIKKFPKKR